MRLTDRRGPVCGALESGHTQNPAPHIQVCPYVAESRHTQNPEPHTQVCPYVVVIASWLSIRLRLRQVERRVAGEETARHKFETGSMNGHDRPLFGTRQVCDAHRIPEHYVLILDRAVGP